jgi:hypothetical protein
MLLKPKYSIIAYLLGLQIPPIAEKPIDELLEDADKVETFIQIS